MKGIILAGGTATRLFPSTLVVSKQLLPVGGKPMVYYPLSTLMLALIKEVLIISTPRDLPLFKQLLGSGEHIGMEFSYAEQEKPAGIAQAFLIADKVGFADGSPLALVLGDNIYYGSGLSGCLQKAASITSGAHIFGYEVPNPQRFGVVEFDENGDVVDIVEKPSKPKSNYAVPGFYTYGPEVVEAAKSLAPSHRGELEITDLNYLFLQRGKLIATILPLGIAWVDTGTDEDMSKAQAFISINQEVRKLWICCIEEIALRNGWITKEEVMNIALTMKNSAYGEYLKKLTRKKDWPYRTT